MKQHRGICQQNRGRLGGKETKEVDLLKQRNYVYVHIVHLFFIYSDIIQLLLLSQFGNLFSEL